MRAIASSSGWRCAGGSSRGDLCFDRDDYPHERRGAAGHHGRGGPAAMRIGIPSEIKQDEYRVAITPAGVRELTSGGHEVIVQAGAGEGSAMGDEEFVAQGARIV